MNLFLDQAEEFHKEAAFAARLSEQPENWPQEINSELFKQLPFLSDYQVDVHLDRQDPERGAAFGYADVSNKTERPEAEHQEMGMPHIRIPVIVMDRSVKPFSVFLDGERVLPLTEDRLRHFLFSPNTFDLSTATPRDQSLVEPLMPPQRSGIGMGGEYKMASAESAFFEKLNSGVTHAFGKGLQTVGKTIVKHPGKSALGAAALATAPVIAAAPRAYRESVDEVKREERGKLKKSEIGKEAFSHISKPQWEAIYNSDKIKALIERKGSKTDPEVVNAVYEMASKTYGFHPKVYNSPAKPDGQQQAPAQEQKAPPPQQKTASLLLAIAPTIRESDRESFIDKLSSDHTTIAAFQRIGFDEILVEALDNTKTASADERLAALAESIEPTVVTFQKLPGGDFLVKSANTNAFAPGPEAQGQVVSGEEAGQAIGQDTAQQMQPGQTATAVAEPVVDSDMPAPVDRTKVVEEFGQYKVQDMHGNSLVGHVFPHVLSFDDSFSPQPMAFFTNGSAYAVQDSVAGEFLGKSTNLPDDEPRGDGVFYCVRNGEAFATVPVTIGSTVSGPDGQPKCVATDAFGQEIQISHVEGLKTPMRVADNEFALPSDWKFMRVNNQTQLVPDPLQMNKSAAVMSERNSVVMFYNGGFNLEGGCGLEKISSDYRYDLDPVSAEFMLGLLGVEGGYAKAKVAECRKKGKVKLNGLRSITLLGERYAQAEKTAAALLYQVPDLRIDLTKEAAYVDDADTIDKLLALNFINPENLNTFINYIPELECCSEKLAEMLLYSYMGMKELPEGNIDRAMKNVEETVKALKTIAYAEG